MLALARAGAKVLHPKSVELAMAGNVPLRLLSSFCDGEGTRVCRLPEGKRPRLAGITGQEAEGRITLVGRSADAGTLSAAVLELARLGIAVTDGVLLDNAVSLTVAPEAWPRTIACLHNKLVLAAGD